MCVIGNPPYSVSSNNRSPWIQNLIADYKKELNERKINLDDDYIKFIRYGQHYIDKNGEGILAYISANSFIDGVTHRQMRRNLLESFDKVYILDLHGNAKKKEVCPDGSVDQNVFDIMQGVSINIFIKTGKKKKNELGQVFHSELYGKREFKYNALNNNSILNIKWNLLLNTSPNYFFVIKNFEEANVYELGFKIIDIFKIYGSGFKTERDAVTIHFSQNSIKQTVSDFKYLDENEIRQKYNLGKDARDWGVLRAKNDIVKNDRPEFYKKVVYRPFDERFTYFTGTSKGFIGTPGTKVNSQLLKDNVALLFKRQCKQKFSYVFLVNKPCESCTFESAFANNISFPLYHYPDSSFQQSLLETSERTPNLNLEIIAQIEKSLDLTFVNEKISDLKCFAPIDILDYIYAVLHSPSYRETYKEFLKIDFPRVPYPTDADKFWKLVEIGTQIRELHLLESPLTENYITGYPEDGDNIVTKPRFVSTSLNDRGQVYINETQYFSDVPEIAWNFYIGGYQPAQKWLKDRKERELSYEDILHYQKIIVALAETDRLMKEVDKVGVV
jgi:predicted helicase